MSLKAMMLAHRVDEGKWEIALQEHIKMQEIAAGAIALSQQPGFSVETTPHSADLCDMCFAQATPPPLHSTRLCSIETFQPWHFRQLWKLISICSAIPDLLS